MRMMADDEYDIFIYGVEVDDDNDDKSDEDEEDKSNYDNFVDAFLEGVSVTDLIVVYVNLQEDYFGKFRIEHDIVKSSANFASFRAPISCEVDGD